ncbi:hypothetical protein IW262DRAFT_886345 [Armillaria fumosa]|nr:hypothetical protein IW262DRAFT_886345 [Armillaria fumosa]
MPIYLAFYAYVCIIISSCLSSWSYLSSSISSACVQSYHCVTHVYVLSFLPGDSTLSSQTLLALFVAVNGIKETLQTSLDPTLSNVVVLT